MTESPEKPTGVLLAGGQSRRMADAFADGQGDKGLLDIAGRPMIAHVIARLSPQVGHMVINANGDPARLAEFGLPVVPDPIDGYPGPLAGILAGMRWSAAHAPGATHVLSVATDAPFIPADLAGRLAAALRLSTGRIALARSASGLHPVIGLWPVALADDLETALRAGTRKVLAWTDNHGTVAVDFPLTDIAGCAVDPFFNANTPAELAEARRLLTSSGNLC